MEMSLLWYENHLYKVDFRTKMPIDRLFLSFLVQMSTL